MPYTWSEEEKCFNLYFVNIVITWVSGLGCLNDLSNLSKKSSGLNWFWK